MKAGFFSLCLRSMQAQVASLFEGVGGSDAVNLLDEIGKLSPEMQQILLRQFTLITRKAVENHNTNVNNDDTSECEDNKVILSLCEEILNQIDDRQIGDKNSPENDPSNSKNGTNSVISFSNRSKSSWNGRIFKLVEGGAENSSNTPEESKENHNKTINKYRENSKRSETSLNLLKGNLISFDNFKDSPPPPPPSVG
jgi:hypothetical protein